jgi:phytol kinase
MWPTDIPYAIAFSALFFATFGSLEWCTRRFGWSPNYTRRVAHVLSGVLVLIDYFFISPIVFVLLVAGSTVLIGLSQWFQFARSIHNVSRRTYGEVLLSVGYLVAHAINSAPEVFVPSVLVIMFADSLAGIATDLRGQTRHGVAGTVVFAVVALVILLTATTVPWYTAIAIALSLTVVERVSPWGSDNVTIPAAAAVALSLFQS